MRKYLAMESRVIGESKDLFWLESRKVVIKEAPANMDWAMGTPMNSKPDQTLIVNKEKEQGGL